MSLGWNGLILRLFIDVKRWFYGNCQGRASGLSFGASSLAMRALKPEVVFLPPQVLYGKFGAAIFYPLKN